MPYVDLAGLSRFAGKSKDFASSACAGLDMANWQRTPEAGAVSFLPVPEMPLEPVVDFMFTETPPASGDKSPSNPSTITGVTQAKVTRCGKNLIRYPYYYETRTINDVTFTVNSDGSITASGTASARCVFWVNNIPSIPLAAGEEYVVSGCPSGGGWSSYSVQVEIRKDDSYVGSAQHFGTSESRNLIAASTDNRTGHVFIEIASGVTVSNLVFYPQLELGSVITSFEKYDGIDYTANLGGTFYGGSVDLSAGTMTVTHKHVQLTGANAYIYFNEDIGTCNRFSVTTVDSVRLAPAAAYTNPQTCTHFNYSSSWNLDEPHFYVSIASNGVAYFYTTYATVDALKEWLASEYQNGTPVEFVYPLATPYTVQLSPTQIYSLSQPDPYAPRINTVYSDQVSVQVGYPKSPQASQTELTNAIVSLGGNV